MSPEIDLQDIEEIRAHLESLTEKVNALPETYRTALLTEVEQIQRCLSGLGVSAGETPEHFKSRLASQEADDLFRILADNIPQLAWMADETGWIFWYNHRWYDYTGSTFEQMQGWGWQSVHHPDTVGNVVEKFREHIQKGEAWEDTFPLRGKDQQYRWFLSRAMPIKDKNGKVFCWFGTNTDVTEQRSIDQFLRENERRFRLALNAAPITVFTTDSNLRYTWLYKGRFGFSVEEMLGKRDDELNPEKDISELMALKRQVIETGQGVQQEVKARIRGEEVVYFDNLEPIFDEAGRVIGLTGAAFDLSQQRRMEAEHHQAITQMEVQRRLLEHRERLRQKIARDVHDGPIQSIVSILFELQLARGVVENEEAQAELAEINDKLKRAVQELRDMVNELRPPELIHLGLARAVRIHAEDFREKHPEVQLSLDLTEELNMLSEEACLELYRIYQESLNNVVRHAQASEVQIKLYHRDHSLIFEIRDNGVGFVVPDDWVDLARQNHFGMAGMRERVEAVSGRIRVESMPGQGTIIKVYLPDIQPNGNRKEEKKED